MTLQLELSCTGSVALSQSKVSKSWYCCHTSHRLRKEEGLGLFVCLVREFGRDLSKILVFGIGKSLIRVD